MRLVRLRWSFVFAGLASASLLFACKQSHVIASECSTPDACVPAVTSPESMPEDRELLPFDSDRVGTIDIIDLLLVVDDGPDMAEEQARLSRAIGRLIAVLRSGDIDGAGAPEFYAVRDVRVGVLTPRPSAPFSGLASCAQLGPPRIAWSFDNAPTCLPLTEGTTDQDAGALSAPVFEVECSVRVGTAGCEYAEPLEAALRAPAPEDTEVDFGELEPLGDSENVGFLREDSLRVVLVVTNDDDCSARDASLFQGGTRRLCFEHEESLHPLMRYAEGLPKLAPSDSQRVMFFAIAGVPPDLVDESRRARFTFERGSTRNAFYDELLADPRMQARRAEGASEGEARQAPACTSSATGPAYPARRLTEVARSFGRHGLVQSSCQDDYRPAIDAFARAIARRLGTPSL